MNVLLISYLERETHFPKQELSVPSSSMLGLLNQISDSEITLEQVVNIRKATLKDEANFLRLPAVRNLPPKGKFTL